MTSIADVFVTVLPETGQIASGMERAFRQVDPKAREAGRRWGREIERGIGDVRVNLVADTTRARREIDDLTRDRTATIEIDADTARARAEIDLLTRDRTMNINVDLNSLSALLAQLAQLGGAAGGAGGSVRGLSGGLSSMGSSGAAGAAAMAALVPVLVSVAGIAAAAAGALALIPAALTGIGLGAGTLMVGMQGITDAFSASSDAASSAAKDARTHASAVQSASRSVESATRSMTSAIRSEQQAQKDVARARRDAKRELEDLNSELRNGSLNETQALLDLEAAQQRLATGTFETSTDYKQAQLDVLQAEQNVTDVRARNGRLEQDAAEKRAKGVEGADAVVAANERLAAAQESVAAAQQAVADAQAKLAETQAASATAAEKAAEAMAKLSPNAQAFVNALIALKPVYDDFKNTIQDALFANLGTTLTDTVNALLPAILPGLTRIAGAFNTMFQGIGTFLQNPENLAMIEGIVNNIATAFENLAPAIGPLLTAFTTLTSVGSGFLPGLATGLANLATSFSNLVTNAAQSGDLEKFIQTALDTFSALAPILPSIISAFMSLAPYGKLMAETFSRFIVAASNLFQALAPVISFVSIGFLGSLAVQMELLTKGINLLVDGFKWLKTYVPIAWEELKKLASLIRDTVVGAISAMWSSITDKFPILKTLEDKFRNAWDAVKNIFADVKSWMGTFFNWLRDKFIGWIPASIRNLIPDFNVGSVGTPPNADGTINTPGGDLPYNTADRRGDNTAPNPAPPAGPSPASPGASPASVSTPYTDVTVPIVQNPDGTWTSPNAEWAKLIKRESSGNATAVQGDIGDANNASGDLALGLFQITTATWVANGGSQFAPNAKSATPQQQAIVAARIFSARGGQPWGAVPGGGREDEAGLRAGLVTGSGVPVSPVASSSSGTPVFVTNWPTSLGGSVSSIPGATGPVPAITQTGPANAPTVQSAAAQIAAQWPGKGITFGGSRAPGENASDAGLKRPDHLSGNALDVMIGKDMALGDAIAAWAESNKAALGIDYIMWREPGHFDHVHLSFKAGATPSVAGMPGQPGSQTVTAQPTVPGSTSPSPAVPGDTTSTAPVELDPNIPPGQQKKDKDAKKKGDDLGKDFVDGIFEAFGFDGTVFKDPRQFGLVKLGTALLNYFNKVGESIADPNNPNNPNGTPHQGSGASPGPGNDGTGGSGLVDFVTGFIPQPFGAPNVAGQHEGSGAAPGPVNDHSFNVNIGQAGASQDDVLAAVDDYFWQSKRQNGTSSNMNALPTAPR